MKVTVLPPDKVVIVDGKALTIQGNFPAEIAAASWDGNEGRITYVDLTKPEVIVKNDAVFRPYYQMWVQANKLEEARIAEEKQRQAEERDARPPKEKMFADPKYPAERELVFALVLAVVGKKPAKLNALAKELNDLAAKYGVDVS